MLKQTDYLQSLSKIDRKKTYDILALCAEETLATFENNLVQYIVLKLFKMRTVDNKRFL